MKGVIHNRVVCFFRIASVEDWRLVRAADVLSVNGVGKGYLNKLRLWLAHRKISLRDDNSPAYWIEVLAKRVEYKLDGPHNFGVCPFTIIVDSNEELPFCFTSMTDSDGNIVNVPTKTKPLWTMGLADYSIEGMEEDVQIERKSLDDLLGTLSGRRENFEKEIARLDGLCSFSAIVCEASWIDILQDVHEHGARAKSVSRTFLSWAIKYPRVHWIMCAGREHAEIVTYRLLSNFWWQSQRELACEEGNALVNEMFAKI